MSKFMEILAYVGIVESIILIIGFLWVIVMWFKGIAPALYRLGNGLARRKVAVFAKGDKLSSLRNLLLDSKLFSKNNIIEISSETDLGKAEDASVYLLSWLDWNNNLEEVLNKKPDKVPIIVYAPHDNSREDGGRIPNDVMQAIDNKRNAAVTNFRGRLLNDIVTAMITTIYQK